MFGLITNRYYNLGYILGDGGVVTMFSEVLEVFLRRVCIKIGGTAYRYYSIDLVDQCFIATRKVEKSNTSIYILVG